LELKHLLIGFACVLSAMCALVTFLKWREVRAAKSWLPVPGKIVSSRVEAREVTSFSSGSDTRGAKDIRNFPAITFDYMVNGRRLQGTRHSLREEIGNFQVPETLARYPRGAEVTVYYDPSDPRKAVIDRTMPEGSIGIMAYISAGLVVGSIALVFFVSGVVDAMRPHLPRPENAGAGMLLTIMALIVLRMGFAQKAIAEAARQWPIAKGRITASGAEAFRIRDSLDGNWTRQWRTIFRSRVRYAYEVAGENYVSGRIAFGATVRASMPAWVGGDCRHYAEGGKVEVHYDPKNPAAAVLECSVRGLWILWGVAGAMFIGAVVLAGLI
jgi:Protein of unknown function (DUF3592)